MKTPRYIEEIITKEGVPYKELKEIIMNATVAVDDNSWNVTKDKLVFPVELNKEEIFELVEYYFLEAFDNAVYLDMYYSPTEFHVEGDKHYGIFMLALTVIFFIGVIAFIIMIAK